MSLPVYAPQEGGDIPVYAPQEGGDIPVYAPQEGGSVWTDMEAKGWMSHGGVNGWPVSPGWLRRQRGGTLGRHLRSAMRFVRPKLDKAKDALVASGTKSLAKVATDVVKGKDLKEALTDAATEAKVDLKRKIEETAHAALEPSRPAKKKKKRKTPKMSREMLNTLFDD